ncbi:hypothetical protein [Stackebrandtia nassauensis]|uniref:Uncharacterized protein n=1 Tax=Stackebrandtia nassauensis (strain DSM 44728 / CIP 108903 / NRRL B-16338 / NBRC 102104 / LLR-40K-21) TaxID=446470 RepID=D3Q0G2_STANL|nr:hypothetical protein [Stackebrandtia nassauensis]ADD41698.1 hypothetical protein Snas_2002 [Stackebrandtia nassauensis DSM 44728]
MTAQCHEIVRHADLVMTEHPAWRATSDGYVRIFDLIDSGRIMVIVSDGHAKAQRQLPGEANLVCDLYTLQADTCQDASELARALTSQGTVGRFRTTNLWEALGTAVCFRQDVPVPTHAYHFLCLMYGEQVPLPRGGYYLMFPTPDIIVELSPSHLASCGIGAVADVLIAAADVYARCSESWNASSPGVLVSALQTITGVDSEVAATAIADWSGDFAFYTYANTRMRTLAATAAPKTTWPRTQTEFSRRWRHLANGELSTLTALMLAWGWRQHRSAGR